jgi:hypothetical protein|tara:strand:- start:14 stop:229 length:216 start_codon:yes stop_codon:yes gene_type:complete
MLKLTMEPEMEQELKTQLQLESHEKECAMFRELVHGKLDSLDKRMWRLEAMIMGSTLLMVGMVITVFMGMK